MATMVGTQANFAKALKELAELDYDAKEAYKTAISMLKSHEFKTKLQEFCDDHERHIEEINDKLLDHSEETVDGPSGKQWLTKGKVALSNIIGDDITILKAMLSNEEDTNKAYDNMVSHDAKWEDTDDILRRALEDERKHKSWLAETINKHS